MKLTLTKVSYSAALSEETSAFSATVCIDGTPAFIASNHGTGGGDEYQPLKGQSYADMRAQVQRVADWAKTLPKEKAFGYDQDVETLVGDALAEWQLQKDVTRVMKKMRDRVLFITGTELRNSKPVPLGLIDKAIDFFGRKHPDALILNRLPREAAETKLREVLT